MIDGYLNVCKPPGVTSHDVVARVRRLTAQRRVGHGGTLDPAAAGVLPIALGRATRTTSSLELDAKIYWADVTFGAATDTDDSDGNIVAIGEVDHLDVGVIERGLGGFSGAIEQRPPAFSAVHVAGRRAYDVARAGGAPRLEPRSVRIDRIRIVGWRNPVLSIIVHCGSGTYIRSLARDLGVAVGSRAHLGGLVRLRVGPFDIRDALDYATVDVLAARKDWRYVVWPWDVVAHSSHALVVKEDRLDDFAHGRAWQSNSSSGSVPGGRARAYTEEGALVGMVAASMGGMWQPLRGVTASK